jgi:type I restriction enzyme, S subunit
LKLTEISLGEVIHIKHGFAFSGDKFVPFQGSNYLLTPGNFYEAGGFRLRDGKERSYTGEFPEEYILKPSSVIIAMTEQGEGLLGASAIIPSDGTFLHNQRIGLIQITKPEQIDPFFLYRLFNTKSVRNQIRGSATGTKVKHTAPERVYRVKVKLPSLSIQTRIADILSTYDDLIENNRRQIKLLEESARLLYREWFLRLRFPGHEQVKVVEGVPEGWENKSLKHILTLNYGKALKAEDRIEGEFSVYGSSGVVGRNSKPLVQGPGIIIGRKGNVGSVFWEPKSFWPIDTVYYTSDESDLFLYYGIKTLHFISTDVAVPGLNRDFAYSRELLVPTDLLRKVFNENAGMIHLQIDNLKYQNQKLTVARDLLLPRLMSGEIEI